MSRFFINRPIFAGVISILIVIIGLISMVSLPVGQYPEIVPPTIQVSAMYPGANPAVIADTVAAPIEQQVNGVEKMLYMSSTSNTDGSYNLTVTFELGTDVDMAQVLVQNRVNLASPRLPEDVRRQGVTVKKKSVNFVVISSLFSPDKRFDTLYISNYATINLKDELLRVPGVGDAMFVPTNKDYSMRVWLDPEKLRSRDLTTGDVVSAMKEQNVQVAAGQIGQPPCPSDQTFQYTVVTLGRLTSPSQFENIILKTGGDGKYTYLKDVARIELGSQTYGVSSVLNGTPSVTIIVYQLPGANALQVAKGVRETIARLEKNFPEGLKYRVNWDVSDFVNASIEEVVKTLAEAFVLVVLVVFLFLQSWRATLIPVITIPVALVGTFAFMSAFGFSINMLTLFGLVLAIGIVVDDAIVVVENVERVMAEKHLPPKEATIEAMGEITGPIIGITLVLMSVFIPSAMLPGITGQMYRQFALTIAVATGLSAINALTLSPALCALILTHGTPRKNILFRAFNFGLDKTIGGYRWLVERAIRFAAVSLAIYLGLVALAGWGFATQPTGFIPLEDQGLVMLNVQLPDAASDPRREAVIARMNSMLKNAPGIEDSVLLGGFSILDNTYSSNLGGGFLCLKPWSQRYAKDNADSQNLMAIVRRLWGQMSQIQEGVVAVFAPPPILGLGTAGGFRMQVLDKGNLGLPMLETSVEELVRNASSQSMLSGVNTRFRATTPQLYADVDRAKAKSLDVPLQEVFNTMQAFLGSTYVNDFNIFGRVNQVTVQADSSFRAKIDDVKRLFVRNSKGQMIPLGTLVQMRQSVGPSSIIRYNLYPSAAVDGSPAAGVSSGQALALMEQAAERTLPAGMGYAWTDMAFQEKRVGNQGVLVLCLAVLVVFLVLAAQYESWTNPFAVIMAVPMALLGAVAAVAIRGLDVNLYTQIGLVLLVALAAKNAILIVEFAREAHARGRALRDSAIEGARLRFRPIMMTSLAFNLGVLPLVVATGAGAAGRVALGTAVFGGMIAATIFPVIFVPVLYVAFQGLSERLSRKKAAKPLSEHGQPG
ncbi:MAG: multidrug efflux RND transporter permease subunit [Phycisphaerae bacterium]|jgi:HAE1 family hydrophobic/amphiphilic exporter-1